jgi:hypothetical protein
VSTASTHHHASRSESSADGSPRAFAQRGNETRQGGVEPVTHLLPLGVAEVPGLPIPKDAEVAPSGDGFRQTAHDVFELIAIDHVRGPVEAVDQSAAEQLSLVPEVPCTERPR